MATTQISNRTQEYSKRRFSKLKAKSRRLVSTLFLSVFLTLLLLPSYCYAVNYTYTYGLLDHPSGSTRYQLMVSVTSSLYNYYQSRDHRAYSYSDLAKFVTPNCLSPIANSLLSTYSDDEDLANGVLMIVHQIPYEKSGPHKYPIETIVQNKGDCDLLSFVAASIMKAAGLDVVLLFYETISHMNVGVHLSHQPRDARTSPTYFTGNGKQYYMAECTGDNWEIGWRLGECPDNVKLASARVITLEKCEQSSPERVSSSLSLSTASSTIRLALSSTTTVLGRSISISGLILPIHPNGDVTIYIKSDGSWDFLAIVKTDSNGQYSYTWTPQSSGAYDVRASWSGDADHVGADSDIHTVMVIPFAQIVTFKAVDAAGNALTNAKIIVDCANGTVLTLYTDGSGRIYLTNTPYGYYSVTVYWKGVNVGAKSVNMTSGENYVIRSSVYDLTAKVKNVLDIAVSGAKVRVYSEGTSLVAEGITAVGGEVEIIQLPEASYRIEVSCFGIVKSRTISLNSSTMESFHGMWDLTSYAIIAGFAIAFVVVMIAFLSAEKSMAQKALG